MISVKLQNPEVEKGQTDKSLGDRKKLDAAGSTCQCVCHSKAKLSAPATADKSAVVDLNVSACQESSPPSPAVAGQSRWSLQQQQRNYRSRTDQLAIFS